MYVLGYSFNTSYAIARNAIIRFEHIAISPQHDVQSDHVEENQCIEYDAHYATPHVFVENTAFASIPARTTTVRVT
jgi:hypothetical protein